MKTIPTAVRIVEVGARDGLQNESILVPTQDKIQFINLLTQAGFPEIEAGAFVHPKAVPQMADSMDVIKGLDLNKTAYTALVPNQKGMEAALKSGIKKVAVFAAATEGFSQNNIRCSIAESIERFKPVIESANENNIAVRGYVSTAFVCPYDGEVKPEQVDPVIQQLVDLGITDISIGDTIGKATPAMVDSLLTYILSRYSGITFGMHFHDTDNRALENVGKSLEFGISVFDSSAAGLGGCPFAPGAKGNLSSNDLVRYLEGCGIATGIDMAKLEEASQFIRGILQKAV